MIKPWKILSSQTVIEDQYIKLRSDRCQRADGHIVPTYHVVEFTEWVTLVPLTAAGEIVLVNEYRHAAQKMLLGLPGGMMDLGETDKMDAAARELREETGYQCEQLIHIGSCYPNPAVQNNQIHLYLGLDARLSEAQTLDPNEEIEVVRMPSSEFLAYEALPVQHAIHAAALFYVERYFSKHPEHRPPLR